MGSRAAKLLTVVAVTVSVLLGTAGVAQAGTRHYAQYNCYWEKNPYYENGFPVGNSVTAYCPTGAPGTQWRARVTWHSNSYQYYTIQFDWLNQGTANWGYLYSYQGLIDEVTYWEFR